MEADSYILLGLFIVIILLDSLAIVAYKKFRMPLWLSGIIIGILGPIISMVSMSFFLDTGGEAGSNEGVAIVGGFIALVIIANGLIMLIIGMIQSIKARLQKRKEITP
ncbi:ABC transporter permease [Priestia koreensis]|uniref:ABC transporter permease n=1 Tax=Priestia koreensis TaxID=284581 RepID=UPI00203B1A00|nr:ABC transporter permease [Priestia koreensis]MCM3006461.1 ABC transporter permease [Priestia koreensis]